jgi:hypothetical protein
MLEVDSSETKAPYTTVSYGDVVAILGVHSAPTAPGGGTSDGMAVEVECDVVDQKLDSIAIRIGCREIAGQDVACRCVDRDRQSGGISRKAPRLQRAGLADLQDAVRGEGGGGEDQQQ